MRKFILVFILVITSATAAGGEILCQKLFEGFDLDKIIQELADLRLELDLAKANNDDRVALVALTKDYAEKEQGLMDFILETTGMTKSELLKKIAQDISKTQNSEKIQNQNGVTNRLQQLKTIDESIVDGYRITFRPLSTNSFNYHNRKFGIESPSEVSATHISQFIWKRVAEIANAKLGTNIKLEPAIAEIGEMLPVVHVFVADVQEWIVALNKLSEKGDIEIREVLADFKKGDRFRLPFEMEWEILARAGGKYNGLYYFDVDSMEKYLWLPTNSHGIQAVAKKDAISVNGFEFFDVGGNVREFLLTSYDSYISRGGSAYESKVGERTTWGQESSNDLGFRLVREVRGQ